MYFNHARYTLKVNQLFWVCCLSHTKEENTGLRRCTFRKMLYQLFPISDWDKRNKGDELSNPNTETRLQHRIRKGWWYDTCARTRPTWLSVTTWPPRAAANYEDVTCPLADNAAWAVSVNTNEVLVLRSSPANADLVISRVKPVLFIWSSDRVNTGSKSAGMSRTVVAAEHGSQK